MPARRAWGARLAGQVIALGPALGDTALIWTAAAALTATVKGLAFLAAGVTFRWPAAMSHARLVAGAAAAVVVTAGDVVARTVLPLPAADLPLAAFQSIALFLAGLAFWPDDLRKGRGAGVLAATFVMWAGLRLALALESRPRSSRRCCPRPASSRRCRASRSWCSCSTARVTRWSSCATSTPRSWTAWASAWR